MADLRSCRRCGAPIGWLPGYRWPVSVDKGYFEAYDFGPDVGIVARTGQKIRGRWIDAGIQGAFVCHREHLCQLAERGEGT